MNGIVGLLLPFLLSPSLVLEEDGPADAVLASPVVCEPHIGMTVRLAGALFGGTGGGTSTSTSLTLPVASFSDCDGGCAALLGVVRLAL
jgi:hypothetical protein